MVNICAMTGPINVSLLSQLVPLPIGIYYYVPCGVRRLSSRQAQHLAMEIGLEQHTMAACNPRHLPPETMKKDTLVKLTSLRIDRSYRSLQGDVEESWSFCHWGLHVYFHPRCERAPVGALNPSSSICAGIKQVLGRVSHGPDGISGRPAVRRRAACTCLLHLDCRESAEC